MKGLNLYEQLQSLVDDSLDIPETQVWRPQTIEDVVVGLDIADDFLLNYMLQIGGQDEGSEKRYELHEAIQHYVETGDIYLAIEKSEATDPIGDILQSPTQILFNTTYRGTEAAVSDFYRIHLFGDADFMDVQAKFSSSLSDICKGIHTAIYLIGYSIGQESGQSNRTATQAQELFNWKMSA